MGPEELASWMVTGGRGADVTTGGGVGAEGGWA